MITLKNIYLTINAILEKEYGNIPIVSMELVEGEDKPYFYIQILPITIDNTSINYGNNKYSIIITYYPKNPDSVQDISMFSKLKNAFGYGIMIKNQEVAPVQQVYAILSDFDMDYAGQDDNIPQYSFNIAYTEYIQNEYEEQIANEIQINRLVNEEEM